MTRKRQFRPDRKKMKAAAEPKMRPQPKRLTHMMVFSYWPLLRSLESFGLTPAKAQDLQEGDEDTVREVMDHLDQEYTAGAVEAIAWSSIDGVPAPVFVMDRAKEVAEHLTEWAEGNPGEWFKMRLISRDLDDGDTQYAIVLMPDLEKGIQRMRANTGIEEEMTYTIVFRPIRFTGRGPAFKSIEGMLPDRIRLSFLDKESIDFGDAQAFENLGEQELIEVGEFELERCTEDDTDMVEVLEDQDKPLFEGWVNPNFKV